MMNQKKATQLSIVIAVDDRLLDPRGWFQALYTQTLPADSYEVIIVDSCHDTEHQSAFNEFCNEAGAPTNISYQRIERGGRASALNHALGLAASKLIVFLGDDCLAPHNFAEAHLRFHQTNPATGAVAIGSALIPPYLRTPFTDWLEKSGRLWGVPVGANMTAISEDFFYAANASVKRELLDRAGRFDERFAHHAWDDFEFGERLRAGGMKASLLPEASVQHLHKIDLPAREDAMRLAGEAAKVYARIYPGVYPWSKSVNSPAPLHWLRNGLAYLRTLIDRKNGALEKWWQCRLDAAFAEGFRNADRSNRS